MRSATCVGFMLGMLWLTAPGADADEPGKTSETVSTKSERFLGIVTEPISDAMAAQLKGVLGSHRGLLVKRVLPESPAAKAGIEPFDVVFQAQGQPVESPEQLRNAVSTSSDAVKLQYIRHAQIHTLDVMPGERTVSRLILRHKAGPAAPAAATEAEDVVQRAADPARQPEYSVSVQTRNGREFQVDVQLHGPAAKVTQRKFTGSVGEVAQQMKSLPEPVQKSLTRQLAQLTDGRTSPKTVQFRFRPQREGNRQVLVVTMRKPIADGVVQSFELHQPMPDATATVSLDNLLDNAAFATQLQDLDPAVRARIESTLKTAALPASKLRVEESQ